MPILPSADNLNRLTPTPGQGVASYGNASAPALAFAEIGADVRKMAEQEQLQLDDLRVSEAITKLRQKELDLTLGEQGYANVKGGDVLARPLAKDFGDHYDKVATDLGSGLTGRQRAKFDQAAQRGKSQFQAGVMRHSLVETEKAYDVQYKNGLEVAKETLAKMPENEMARLQALDDIKALTVKAAERAGFRLGNPDSDKVISTLVTAAQGDGHMRVIESLIHADKLPAADEYLKTNSKGMTADQVKTMTNKLKPLNDNALGTDMGIQAFTMLKEGKPATDVALWVADKAKGNPHAASAANAELNRLQAADKIDDENKRGTYLLRIVQQPGAATAAAIRKDVLKDSTLDPGQKAAVLKTVDDLQHMEQSRQREDIRWARSNNLWNDEQKGNKVEAFMKFAEIRYAPDFADKTPEQLASYTSVIGPTLTKQLLDNHGALKNQATAAAARFQIDKDLLGEAIPEGILKDKSKLMAFRGIVETNLQTWKQQNPGKLPSLEEQRKLALSARKDWVEIGTLWNSTSPQYEIQPGDKAVPADFYAGAKEAAAKRKQKITDAQILQMWQLTQPAAK